MPNPQSRLDQAAIEAARCRRPLSSVVAETVKLRRTGHTLTGLCPFHKEKTPSLNVDDRRGTFKCYGCGEQGDIIDFMMAARGMTFREAIEALGGADVTGSAAPVRHESSGPDPDVARVRSAADVWRRTSPAIGTLASQYLFNARGINGGILNSQLRFLEAGWCSPLRREAPALVAALRDRYGALSAVQQVFLDASTGDALRDTKGRRIKRTLGPMRDATVRLAPAVGILGLAGSVEDALSAQQLFSIPVWATCGEGRLSTVWVPDDLDRLIIFADADEAGQREAEKAAKRHRCAVEIMTPDSGKDWNDYLRGRQAT